MARRTETVTIEEENRDKGKVFILTEMAAIAGERWASRLLELLKEHNVVIPEELANAGTEGLAAATANVDAMGFMKVLRHPDLETWWDCVQYQHDPRQMPQKIVQGDACQIEEIATITRLRLEVLALHTAFFSGAKGSTTESPSPAIPTGSSPTRMSRPRSAR